MLTPIGAAMSKAEKPSPVPEFIFCTFFDLLVAILVKPLFWVRVSMLERGGLGYFICSVLRICAFTEGGMPRVAAVPMLALSEG